MECIVAATQALWRDDVIANIDRALAGAGVAQRATEYRAAFAVDEAAVGDPIATAVGDGVVGLAVGIGGDAQGCPVDGEDARCQCGEVVVASGQRPDCGGDAGTTHVRGRSGAGRCAAAAGDP